MHSPCDMFASAVSRRSCWRAISASDFSISCWRELPAKAATRLMPSTATAALAMVTDRALVDSDKAVTATVGSAVMVAAPMAVK